jgi:ATP-dependent RNA helicase DDX60
VQALVQETSGQADASESLKKGKGKKEKEPKLSSADKLRQKIKAEKETKSVDELTLWWDEQLAKMGKMSLQDQITQTELLQRSAKAKEGWLAVEIRVWRLHLELLDWIAQADLELDKVQDWCTVKIMRMVKTLYEMSPISPSVLGILASVLISLGFADYIPSYEAPFEADPSKVEKDRKPRFDFVKLVKKSGSAVHKFMKIKEHPIIWQLRLFGEFMDRSMDSAPDRRVLFKPDAWQRKVLDCLDDDGHSVLVVGKYFHHGYMVCFTEICE